MAEDAKKPPAHEGYAGGSAVLDLPTLEAAVKRLLDASTKTSTPNPDGSVVVRTFHETDPSEHFIERRSVKRPGPLPTYVVAAEIAKGARVLEHEHEAIVSVDDDLDLLAYHFARWAVLECRRVHAKALSIRSVASGDSEGSCVVKVAFLR